MLEWSSLYRVALLLSKINDDADLDAEAAILYGKVGLKRLRKRYIYTSIGENQHMRVTRFNPLCVSDFI